MTDSRRSEDIRLLTWRLDAFHSASYFAPELRTELAAAGLVHGSDQYLASRAAPLGAVGGEAVTSVFYAFGHDYVCRSLPKVWETTSPQQAHAARLRGVAALVERARSGAAEDGLPGGAAQIDADAARLCEELAPVVAAMDDTYRPLSAATRAALAQVPGASDPVLALWITATHLREYRGDSHGAVLATSGVTGAVASILHSLDGGPFPPAAARRAHGWTAEVWAETVDHLRSAGLVAGADDDTAVPTAAGKGLRAELEAATDAAVAASWDSLDDARLHDLAQLARVGGRLARAAKG
ncbi:hypothetical protein NQ038_10420 [Brevibacterium sp. 50QC2O2]|uniref:SCO6745 family protein n=1 Tax=Brevibacterium TaxID=1696 RepID=UPI00211CB3C5|nr:MULTISPECIES: hypothetical protein [unclassified Brevibacterium]MCQ9367583.1 hypothetical protein [Brevibacterium sp. 91QC2O2]MCQ9386281.1 hypothetical protein [Brevibacterium sp. 68QC2CO]MCQ9389057.1 hypothetical protein [Brevibacterium sp. 50QC2O2]